LIQDTILSKKLSILRYTKRFIPHFSNTPQLFHIYIVYSMTFPHSFPQVVENSLIFSTTTVENFAKIHNFHRYLPVFPRFSHCGYLSLSVDKLFHSNILRRHICTRIGIVIHMAAASAICVDNKKFCIIAGIPPKMRFPRSHTCGKQVLFKISLPHFQQRNAGLFYRIFPRTGGFGIVPTVFEPQNSFSTISPPLLLRRLPY